MQKKKDNTVTAGNNNRHVYLTRNCTSRGVFANFKIAASWQI